MYVKGGWKYGTPLPLKIWMHNMVSYDDRVYVVGGVDTYDVRKNILQYQQGIWKEMESQLKVGRAQTLTIPLTEEQAEEFCFCRNKNDGDVSKGPWGDLSFSVNYDYFRCTRFEKKSMTSEGEQWG